MDAKVTSHLSDRLAGLDHHLHGLSLELRAELTAMLWHEQILSAKSRRCPGVTPLRRENCGWLTRGHRLRRSPAAPGAAALVAGHYWSVSGRNRANGRGVCEETVAAVVR
jgi:hypothetical protein